MGTEATYELTRLRDPTASHQEWVRHGVWARGEGYAHAIIGDLLAGSSGWIDWNVLLDNTGGPNHLNNTCDAPMIADDAFERVYLHPQYYALGHFSKFVPRGSRRVGLDGAAPAGSAARGPSSGVYNLSGAVEYGVCPPGPLKAVALKRPDERIVVVVLNCDGLAKTVRLEVGGASSQAVQLTIPPHAIHTYVLKPHQSRRRS